MNQRFHFSSTALSGLSVIERMPLVDSRGRFERLFCSDSFANLGLEKPVVQINRSLTRRRGALRGMHFQMPPHAEAKVVSCLRGEVFDVAVDIRAYSPTYLQWHGELLSAQNRKSLFVPEGFAHGFQTLADGCELLYLHSEAYAPQAERGLHPLDPSLKIDWPLAITEISERDRQREYLSENFFTGVRL